MHPKRRDYLLGRMRSYEVSLDRLTTVGSRDRRIELFRSRLHQLRGQFRVELLEAP